MKKANILYWIFTALLALSMIFSAIPNIVKDAESIGLICGLLKYPEYIIRFLGLAKLIAAITILIPGIPRLKEWAYAGLFFDIFGATFSLLAVGTPVMTVLPMLIFFVLLFASYFFHHKRLKLKAASHIR